MTNDRTLSELELLHAYKRQPLIEKRFAQLKTDFEVAPVWLKDVGRIEALLGVYFFAAVISNTLFSIGEKTAHHRVMQVGGGNWRSVLCLRLGQDGFSLRVPAKQC